ncbi:MAG: 4Fe-4S binding protein [Candidatus Thermoplasmatota archaeon]|nr:4Fe-4S binding protein [Candidatus Thermoplasmatota archaeon]
MKNYEKTGVLSNNDITIPDLQYLKRGVAIVECIQHIPCNPCVDSCPFNAISMKDINDLPVVDFERCVGCGKCISVCPGLAIFLVKIKNKKALISLPYEFNPVPKLGDNIIALDRMGVNRGSALVKRVVKSGKTSVITIEVDDSLAMEIRNIKV